MQRAGTDLHLLTRVVLDQLLALDPVNQRRVKVEDAVEPEHVRNEVVGEHRQAIEIAELGDAGASEVRRCDLGALQERDHEFVVGRAVGERAPGAELLGEGHGRAAATRIDDGCEPAIALAGDVASQIAQRLREQRHQLVGWILPEHGGDLRRLELGQLRPAPSAAGSRTAHGFRPRSCSSRSAHRACAGLGTSLSRN